MRALAAATVLALLAFQTADIYQVQAFRGHEKQYFRLASAWSVVFLVVIGVSFFAAVGLLLASYVLREWHRDRAALVCLIGGLPLPITIFSLLT